MNGLGIGDAVLLGIVEGITEFLPVSSTAHLKITESALGLSTDDAGVVAFTAVIQVGAIAAVLVYFARDIARIVTAWTRGVLHSRHREDRDYRFGWWVIAATLPIVAVGLAAKPLIEGRLAGLWVVVASLLAGSAFMWWSERHARLDRDEQAVTLGDAVAVGSSQVLALLLPGFSRSGATISTGLLRGLDRVAATRLSFFLSIPALTGAGLYELKDAVGAGAPAGPRLVGTLVSFGVAYGVIAWLLRFVAHHGFGRFIAYRIVLALVLAGLLASGHLAA
ncbi:undecaprenyl-diphosphate phosphatase [Nocardioides sp.]|uniref:undecaprenyl-diphosphate phosphatase n=1 Tax=Nocardioides sp. TaxID=35761 RepID=UPI003219B3DA